MTLAEFIARLESDKPVTVKLGWGYEHGYVKFDGKGVADTTRDTIHEAIDWMRGNEAYAHVDSFIDPRGGIEAEFDYVRNPEKTKKSKKGKHRKE